LVIVDVNGVQVFARRVPLTGRELAGSRWMCCGSGSLLRGHA
jgi:hypothetical protein